MSGDRKNNQKPREPPDGGHGGADIKYLVRPRRSARNNGPPSATQLKRRSEFQDRQGASHHGYRHGRQYCDHPKNRRHRAGSVHPKPTFKSVKTETRDSGVRTEPIAKNLFHPKRCRGSRNPRGNLSSFKARPFARSPDMQDMPTGSCFE